MISTVVCKLCVRIKIKESQISSNSLIFNVGIPGFEPGTPCSQSVFVMLEMHLIIRCLSASRKGNYKLFIKRSLFRAYFRHWNSRISLVQPLALMLKFSCLLPAIVFAKKLLFYLFRPLRYLISLFPVMISNSLSLYLSKSGAFNSIFAYRLEQ